MLFRSSRRRNILTPEAFQERAANLGPPRPVVITISSSLRAPSLVIAAGAIRDSITARLRSALRFVPIANAVVTDALERSRSVDSLRAWLKSDLFLTINAGGSFGSDSLRWIVSLRDYTAHSAYGNRAASSPQVAIASAAEPAVVRPLVEAVLRNLDEMDRAPRRDTLSRREL